MRNYTLLFFYGLRAQFRKLWSNRHKKGFDALSLSYVYKRLKEEVHELDCEIHGSRKMDFDAIRDEFADIANFAHMGIMVCEKWRKK